MAERRFQNRLENGRCLPSFKFPVSFSTSRQGGEASFLGQVQVYGDGPKFEQVREFTIWE